ncbi:MAG: hypothetical protein FGM37_06160, partial [Phycisphaerales bacterium]|nr:hypothetical protein [Phycisphaerales bacterium]
MTRLVRRAQVYAAIFGAAAIGVPSAILVLSGADAGRAAWDAAIYHERVIRSFIEQFPWLDIRNPLTTTTPGYHAALAAFGAAVSDTPIALRLAATAVGAALVAFVAAWCAGRRGTAQGTLLALPLACSVYVIGSAAWPLPDDAAWTLVALTLALSLREPWSMRASASAAAALVALVLVRQVHIWTALPLAVACMIPPAAAARGGHDAGTPLMRRVAVAAATVTPACVAVAAFVLLWRGLVPPRFQRDVTGINLATPAYVLLQFAVAGVAFLPWLGPAVAGAWSTRRTTLALAAAGALAMAAVPATVPDEAAGRYSGLWGALAWLPSVAGHSNVGVLLLAPAGGVLMASALMGIASRPRAILCAAVIGFVAAVTATHYSWQRYHEPGVLLLLAMISALQPARADRSARLRPMMALAIGALCAALWVIAWRGLHGAPVDRTEQP